ncbi:TRAP transporter small permease subunit [Desulfococcaceae bacterium HSG9]|nr:TRAP transporter small permease subunit [Desulfococcaceae bacterium HSG9]
MSHPNNVEESAAQSSRITTILRAIDRISEWEGKLFSFLIVVATIQVCFELVLRYVFNAPTTWGLEMTLYLCSTTYVMAGAYAERYNAHIKVDIFYNCWSIRTRAFFDLIVTDSLLMFFCIVLTWQSAMWFWEAVSQGLTSGTIWDPPIWPMRLIILAGAFFLLLAAFGKSMRDLLLVLKK